MPSSSTLNSEEKDKIKKAIQSGKIVAAAIARVYYAYPDPEEWSYGGVEGALVFGTQDGGFWFRLVDLGGTRGVIWDHEFYDGLDYNQDRTFFYSFAGDECQIGFAFSDEGEAADLYKKVQNRRKYAGKSKSRMSGFSMRVPSLSSSGPSHNHNYVPTQPNLPSPNSSPQQPEEKKKKRRGLGALFDRSHISHPKEVKHVAHISVDTEKGGFNTTNVDPSWEKLLEQLQGFGITREFAENNRDFIKDFIRDAGLNDDGTPAAPQAVAEPPTRAPPPPTEAAPSRPAAPPPPPPGPAPGRPSAPAPPPPPMASAPKSAPPLAPPPPPSGRAPAPPAPPAPPSGAGRPSGPPPPPPAPPSGRGGPPPPPPAPPAGPPRGAAPPPPPPPGGRAPPSPAAPAPAAPGAAIPPAQNGRADLLASIRGAGGPKTLKHVEPGSTPAGATPRVGTPGGAAAAAGAGVAVGAAAGAAGAAAGAAGAAAGAAGAAAGEGDLAAALAAALAVRKTGMGESDDEEDSDDEWD